MVDVEECVLFDGFKCANVVEFSVTLTPHSI